MCLSKVVCPKVRYEYVFAKFVCHNLVWDMPCNNHLSSGLLRICVAQIKCSKVKWGYVLRIRLSQSWVGMCIALPKRRQKRHQKAIKIFIDFEIDFQRFRVAKKAQDPASL